LLGDGREFRRARFDRLEVDDMPTLGRGIVGGFRLFPFLREQPPG
jgi:hypothetical protein